MIIKTEQDLLNCQDQNQEILKKELSQSRKIALNIALNIVLLDDNDLKELTMLCTKLVSEREINKLVPNQEKQLKLF